MIFNNQLGKQKTQTIWIHLLPYSNKRKRRVSSRIFVLLQLLWQFDIVFIIPVNKHEMKCLNINVRRSTCLSRKKSLDWFCVTVEVAFGYRINNGSFNFKYIQMPFFVLKMCDKRLGKDQIRKKQKQNKFKGYSTNSTYMIFRRKYS